MGLTKKQILVGTNYVAKVAGNLTVVRVDRIREVSSFNRTSTVFDVTNLVTSRFTIFKSAQKFRRVATPDDVAHFKRLKSIAKSELANPPLVADDGSKSCGVTCCQRTFVTADEASRHEVKCLTESAHANGQIAVCVTHRPDVYCGVKTGAMVFHTEEVMPCRLTKGCPLGRANTEPGSLLDFCFRANGDDPSLKLTVAKLAVVKRVVLDY